MEDGYDRDDEERHRFQGYLNDSTSFIEELINNMPEDIQINNNPV